LAEFDQTKKVTLAGKVVQMELVNPHSWLMIDMTKADRKVERRRIAIGIAAWRRRALSAGSSRDIEFPDGMKMDMGGSGTKDGQDKQDKYSPSSL
jgi:hypothetical protein